MAVFLGFCATACIQAKALGGKNLNMLNAKIILLFS